MSIIIKEVKSKSDLRKYIYLPAKIHKGHTNWVPPIYMDEWDYYNPKKNETLAVSDTIMLIAEKDGKTVGRILGIINHKHNERHNLKTARFNYLEVWNDKEVADKLLKAVEDWALSKGMNKIIGPFGFSDKDPQGYLIQGFDKLHVMATHCNYEYLIDFIESNGYTKELDLISYFGNVPEEIPPLFSKICERTIKNNPDLKLLEFTKTKDIKPYVQPVFQLLNRTYTEIYGFEEMSTREISEFSSKYLPFLPPEYIKIVVDKTDKPVAFFVATADMSKGVQKAKGKILPFGILRMLRASKKATHGSLLLGGIDPEYRNKGLDTLMTIKIIEDAKKKGIKSFDSHCQMEDNMLMRSAIEKVNAEVYKVFRVFQKPLEQLK